jgi:hypothetical protein
MLDFSYSTNMRLHYSPQHTVSADAFHSVAACFLVARKLEAVVVVEGALLEAHRCELLLHVKLYQ